MWEQICRETAKERYFNRLALSCIEGKGILWPSQYCVTDLISISFCFPEDCLLGGWFMLLSNMLHFFFCEVLLGDKWSAVSLPHTLLLVFCLFTFSFLVYLVRCQQEFCSPFRYCTCNISSTSLLNPMNIQNVSQVSVNYWTAYNVYTSISNTFSSIPSTAQFNQALAPIPNLHSNEPFLRIPSAFYFDKPSTLSGSDLSVVFVWITPWKCIFYLASRKSTLLALFPTHLSLFSSLLNLFPIIILTLYHWKVTGLLV